MRAPDLHPLHLGVEPGLPPLALGVAHVCRVLEVRLEDRVEMDRDGIAVPPVVLLLEEELEELAAGRLLVGGRVRVDHPGLIVELGERRLPHRADGLGPDLEDLGVPLVGRRILIDVAPRSGPTSSPGWSSPWPTRKGSRGSRATPSPPEG